MDANGPTLDRIAHALSDPLRLRILDLLAAKFSDERCSPSNPDAPAAVCACDLRPAMGDIAPSKLAYHLKELRETGLVHEQQRGKWVYYTLNREALAAFSARLGRRFKLAGAAPSRSARGRRRAAHRAGRAAASAPPRAR